MTEPSAKRSLILKVVLPVLLGLAVAALLIWRDFNPEALQSVRFTTKAVICIGLAWLFMAGRDFGYAWRFRVLTDRDLSWGRAARVTMLMEFSSAITPTTVGGSALSAVFMNREGISPGRATTLMVTTLFLDELFFTIACPVVLLLVPYADLFGFAHGSFDSGLRIVFWCVYGFVVGITVLLFCGLFLWPEKVSKLLMAIFRWRLLRRWSGSVHALASDMVATSHHLRRRTVGWWLLAFGSTSLSWISRFMVVNALFAGFAPLADQMIVVGRQFVVWLVLMVSPTPGGSGVSEWLFTAYYGDLIAGGKSVALVLALFWRVISYYVYLIVGVFMIPSFFKKKNNISNSASSR